MPPATTGYDEHIFILCGIPGLDKTYTRPMVLVVDKETIICRPNGGHLQLLNPGNRPNDNLDTKVH